MVDESQSSYRQIVKATSIFGGVQLYQIVISLVRSKIVAVLLGTQGMGIAGLLTSVTTLVSGVTNLGLGVSAVRNVSDAHASGDADRIAVVATVLKKLVWITGLAGSVLMLMMAPWLSQLTFGSEEFTWAFRVLSGTMLLGNISSSQYVLLQGLRKLKELAKANTIGATLGLLVSIPLYYFYGVKGIVPALVISAITVLALAIYFGRKINYTRVSLQASEIWLHGKGMIRMGMLLSLSGLIALAVGYLTRVFITREGGLADVGLYNAGFAMVNTYVGMIFTAMGTDYYPRLSAVATDVTQSTKLVNQQAEMALLLLGPILILFLILLKYAIIILYSSEFLDVVPMVQWSVLAILLKAIAWSMGFLIVAKGDSGVFFYSELIGCAYSLMLNVAGYHWFGLEGLGIAFLITYVLSIIQNFFLIRYFYRYSFQWDLVQVAGIQLLLTTFCFFLVRQDFNFWILLAAVGCWVVVCAYSFYQFNKRLNLSSLVKRVFKK